MQAGKQRVRSLLDELATLEGINLLSLAMEPSVQKDLEVTQEQRDRLATTMIAPQPFGKVNRCGGACRFHGPHRDRLPRGVGLESL